MISFEIDTLKKAMVTGDTDYIAKVAHDIEELSFKWTGVRSARNVDADTFVEACERGDLDFVAAALKNDKSLVNARNKHTKTALMRAAGEGHKDIVKLLIDNGVGINLVDDNGSTALMWAVGGKKDFPDVVKLLLKFGADVNATERCGATALDLAQIGGLTTSIAILKSWGGVQKNIDEDSFIKACECNDIAFVSDALKVNRDFANATQETGISVLMVAASKGYTKIVELLIANGADVNKRSSIGSTALHCGLDSGDIKIVALLINAGADVNAKNVMGAFPLSTAAGRGYYNIVQLLLMSGANVNERTNGPFGGSSALDMARIGGHTTIMSLLRSYGANE